MSDALRTPNSLKERIHFYCSSVSPLRRARGQKNQDKLDGNGTYQLLVYCDDVNSVGEKHKWHKGKHNLY